MNVEDFRNFCLSLPQVVENAPWTDPKYQNLITFTVGGKWFCLLHLESKRCNVKCAPERVVELQSRYQGVQPAWHMNKTHWVTLVLESDVPDREIEDILRRAYGLIVSRLPKSRRQELGLAAPD